MTTPIVTQEQFRHLIDENQWRLAKKDMPTGDTYRDLSTIVVVPILGTREEKKHLNCKKCKAKNEYSQIITSGLDYRVVQSWNNILKPMNQPVTPNIYIPCMEVGAAYNTAIDIIQNSPDLKKFKYVLTLEHDNIVPMMPDTQGALFSLYDCIEKGMDAVGGLYWTKGNPSAPLIYGNPKNKKDFAMFKVIHPKKGAPPKNWKPGKIVTGEWHSGDIVECNGLGMGFTLFKTEIFTDTRLKKPFFKTCNEMEGNGLKMYTQDLYFFENFKKLGYRCAVDTRVRLGHLDIKSGTIY